MEEKGKVSKGTSDGVCHMQQVRVTWQRCMSRASAEQIREKDLGLQSASDGSCWFWALGLKIDRGGSEEGKPSHILTGD